MPTIIDGTNGIDKIAAGAIEYADLPSGSVLQTLSTTITTALSYAGTTPQDIAGLTVSITPKFSTSKILVLVNLAISSASNGDNYFYVLRNSTVIPSSGIVGSEINTGTTAVFNYSMINTGLTYLDSPATTSAITYKLQAATNAGGTVMYVNRRALDTTFTGQSTITVMEIAA